jgi:hypothetical protein
MRRVMTAPTVLKVAETVGRVLNHIARVGRTVPGVAGASLVSYGLYDAWHPLGWIAAGAFLLILDRRTSV